MGHITKGLNKLSCLHF